MAGPPPLPPPSPPVVKTSASPFARGPAWQLDDVMLQRLAQELARELYTVPETLSRYNLDPSIFQERIRHNNSFIKHYQEAYAVWHGSTNTVERIRAKAQASFEDWLSEADRLFHDTQQPMTGKVELMKVVERVGGLSVSDKERPGVAPGDRVLVNINLGAAGAPQSIVIDKIALPSFDASK